jgi:hypothetical protein
VSGFSFLLDFPLDLLDVLIFDYRLFSCKAEESALTKSPCIRAKVAAVGMMTVEDRL